MLSRVLWILYTLFPPPSWDDFRLAKLPDPKLDQDGYVVFEKWPTNPNKPQPLLDFPHLPDQIGSQEWWFVLEAWKRLDPRVRWRDITMRIHGPSRPSSHNNLQMNISRNRSKWGLVSWCTTLLHEKDNRTRQEALNALSNEQISNNTTRGTTPGLINPTLGEAGGRVPVPKNIGRTGRRGRRAPGVCRGGGNNQRKYQEKPSSQKTRQFPAYAIIDMVLQKSQKFMTEADKEKQARQDSSVKQEDENDDDRYPEAIQASVAETEPETLVEDTYTLANLSGRTHGHTSQTSLGQYNIGNLAGYHENGIHSDPIDYVSQHGYADNLGFSQPYVPASAQASSPSDPAVPAISPVRSLDPTASLPPSLYPMVWKKPPLKNNRGANLSTSSRNQSRNESRKKGGIQAPGSHSNYAVSSDSLSIHSAQGNDPPRKMLMAKSQRQPDGNLKEKKSKTIHDENRGNDAQKAKRLLGDVSDDEERPGKIARKMQPYAAEVNRLAKQSKTSSDENTFQASNYEGIPSPGSHYFTQGYSSFQNEIPQTHNMNIEGSTYDRSDQANGFAGYAPDDVFSEQPSCFTQNFTGSSSYRPEIYNPPIHDEEDHDSSDLLPWHDGSSENVHPLILTPENVARTGVDSSDCTVHSFPTLEWNEFDLDF
ncbi:MAG: hypothetical protein Q9211_002528 [Gyalolechia sp. 1 TL-2023]